MNTNGKIGVAANRLVCFLLGAAVTLVASSSGAEICTYEDGAWKDGKAPTAAEDEIVIVSGELTWDSSLPAEVASWTQSGGTVTFQTVFPGQGDFELFEVAGDVSLTGGTWTHAANSANKKEYRLCVDVAGSMVIGPDAARLPEGTGCDLVGAKGCLSPTPEITAFLGDIAFRLMLQRLTYPSHPPAEVILDPPYGEG